MTRNRLAILGSLAALGAIALALAPTAGGAKGAAKGLDCDPHTLCVWENNAAGGILVTLTKPGISNKLAKKMDDQASSVRNSRNQVSYLYKKEDGKGASFCLEPNSQVADLGAEGFGDVASSTRLTKHKKHCPV